MTRRLLLLSILLTGCAHFKAKQYHTAAVSPPSVQPIRTSIGQAQNSVTAAQQKTSALSGNVSRSRTNAERIDAKAIVVKRWLDSRP